MEVMIPQIWLEFGQYIHQDFLSQFPDFRSGVTDFACTLSDERKIEFKEFVTELLNSQPTTSTLSNVWDESGASFYVQDSEIRLLFDEIAAGIRQCNAPS